MDKRKLQEFATWAKLNLERQIELSLKRIGINSDKDILKSRTHGEVTIIEGIETSFKREFHKQREEIINKIREDGYKHSIEQFASTWFNRIVALRFLEVHDYLDHGFKIFPNEPNTLPEIMYQLPLVLEDLKLDMDYVDELRMTGNNNEELYRYIIFQQCNALAKPLPMLFSRDLDYLEYFIPTPLLFGDTIINKLIEIETEDFKEDVEIIGWLYQFYIATKKDEVFASKKKITKDTLPAVTQLFTPNWIVKYMAENSIGRIWLESYPTSQLKSKMEYFVEEAEQEPEVELELKKVRYKNVNPEDIKIIEPCSGSGHILVYCFDLLLEMYIEKGYAKRDIPALIFRNNLVGFDIDQRATQLASFALVMRARSVDNRFFDEERYVRPKVYEIIDSKSIINTEYNGKNYKQIISEYNTNQWSGESKLTEDELKTIDYVVELFKDAKVIGSLLKVKPDKYLTLRNKLIKNVREDTQFDLFTSRFFEYDFKELIKILRLTYYLSLKYDVMITNPPYIGIGAFEEKYKKYFISNYPSSKNDMFTMFMETTFIKRDGFLAMINMHNWMFIDSFTDVRRNVLKNKIILSLLHLGIKAFEDIGNDVVQTCAFIFRNYNSQNHKSVFVRLVDVKDFLLKQTEFYNHENWYSIKPSLFMYTPTLGFSYWVSVQYFKNFESGRTISNYGEYTGSKNITGNNAKYLRFFWEVDHSKIGRKYWVPYSKGGFFRKYYGNIINVIDWREDARDFYKNNKTSNLLNELYWFKPGITYSAVTSRGTGFRYMPEGCIFDYGGPAINTDPEYTPIIMALLNSKIAEYYFKAMNPSINLQTKDIRSLPIILPEDENIIKISKEQIELSKNDWSELETSLDFEQNTLIKLFDNENENFKLEDAFNKLVHRNKVLRKSFLSNEQEINKVFSDIYKLNELEIKFEERDISIRKVEYYTEIVNLISYFVGLLMGRYSLHKNGIIFAGGNFDITQYNGFDVDYDGIIPIYSDVNTEDGVVHRITSLVKMIFGDKNYRENINFIAEALEKKSNETSEETINRYLNDEFYLDHLKIYKKTPIYWMFSSGKLNGFKCLIYMHRYDENTLAKINAGYFQPATMIIRNQITEIEGQIARASENEKRILDKKRLILVEQLAEAREYGQVLDYMANKYIAIDLDDGVKVNYAKFQNIEIISNSGRVKKDLLVPIK